MEEDLSSFKWKGNTFLHQEIITKLQEHIQEIEKSHPPELLGLFYNIYTSNHNLPQMYSLIWTGVSGELCGPCASCFYQLVEVCSALLL